MTKEEGVRNWYLIYLHRFDEMKCRPRRNLSSVCKNEIPLGISPEVMKALKAHRLRYATKPENLGAAGQ